MKKILYGLASACVLLSACTGADEALILPLEVSAEMAVGLTRASAVTEADYDKSSFALDDEISVSLKGSSPSTIYKKGNSGWLPPSGTDGLATTGNQTYVATYPTTFSEIVESQTTMQSFWQSNQLKSEATATANKVTFSFMPVAAKITIVVTYDAAKTSAGATVVGTGIRTNSSSASETINLLLTSGSEQLRHSYVGIIYPGTGRTYTISVKNSGETTQTFTQSAISLVAGRNYKYTFSSSNELILTSVIVTPFHDNAEEDGGSAT